MLSGCGFHLRSYELDSAVESFALTGDTRARIAGPLRRAMSQAGVTEISIQDAALVIDVLDERSGRRSASIAGRARAAEYEMSYGVRFRVLADGTELAAPQWLWRERVYRIDRENIVGSSEEQTILEREMMQDLVSQIVRIVDTVSRNASNTES
jgi:LPS-assembly lipoprotein